MFTSLITASGRHLKLTADHLLLGGECGKPLNLIRADQIIIGSCVQTTSGEESIITISVAAGRGIYTVVTKADGLLVVNGVMASPFASNHLVANSFYNIHRMVSNLIPLLSRSDFAMSTIKAFGDIVLSVF